MRHCRILALSEYRHSSPNYNIAVRLFDEMRKSGVEITNGYLVKDKRCSDFDGFATDDCLFNEAKSGIDDLLGVGLGDFGLLGGQTD